MANKITLVFIMFVSIITAYGFCWLSRICYVASLRGNIFEDFLTIMSWGFIVLLIIPGSALIISFEEFFKQMREKD